MAKREKPKRRGNLEGTIYQRADGRYEAKVTLPDGTRKSFYRKTRKAADDALTKAKGNVAQGIPVSPEKQSVAQYLASWLDGAEHGLKPRTVTSYRNAITHHIAPALGRIKLARLDPQTVRGFYAKKLTAGASASSVRGMHTVLRRALAQAEEDGLVPRNVAAIVKPPRMTRSEMHVLSPEEARILLEAAQGDRLEALYTLALTTGMRIGELCALRFVDVDLKAQALHVRCTLRYRNQDLYFFETPKTPKSRRRIALSAITVDALRAHRTRQLEERLAAGVAWREDD
ncbi:MAG TPA: tyrosine-type recombinase/integrase, partial [Ktedonobacterales bacterium]